MLLEDGRACSELLELSAARESCFLDFSTEAFTASTYSFIFAESTLAESTLAESATAESAATEADEDETADVSATGATAGATLLEETTSELDSATELDDGAGAELERFAEETGAGATLLELGTVFTESADCWVASASNSANRSRVWAKD
jgi:hypothetical protein